MPVTPFHFGIGAPIKAIAPNRFSWGVFCFAQAVADSEVVYAALRGQYPLHRFFHTYLGAVVVALISVAVGRPLGSALTRRCNARLEPRLQASLPVPEGVTWFAAATGALIGAFSHVLLDSFLHADMA